MGIVVITNRRLYRNRLPRDLHDLTNLVLGHFHLQPEKRLLPLGTAIFQNRALNVEQLSRQRIVRIHVSPNLLFVYHTKVALFDRSSKSCTARSPLQRIT